MLPLVFAQIALAATAVLNVPDPSSSPPEQPLVRTVARVTMHAMPYPRTVTAGPKDETALDILNDTRPDILGRGAARHCPPVTAVYVDGYRRVAPPAGHGFSRATLYLAGDTVMVMLPPSVADALRTIPAKDVRDIRYVDCWANTADDEARNVLYVLTR